MVGQQRWTFVGAAAAALTVLSACSATIRSAQPTMPPIARGEATVAASSSATPVGSITPGVVFDRGTIEQDTGRTMVVASSGQYVIWSSGAQSDSQDDAAPDLYAVAPGGEVLQLYDNPNRGSQLRPIVGDGSQFAFIEENFADFGYGGWVLWYIPHPSAQAVEIDRGQMAVLPYLALSGKWLVWTPGPGDLSQIVAMDLTTGDRRTLLSSNVADTQYWYPGVDGDRLVYATIEQNAHGDERHIYLLDLAAPGEPGRLDDVESASEPAIRADEVVWKESDPTLNFVVSGGLIHVNLGTGSTEPLLVRPGSQPTANGYPAGFDFPSVGDRFVAAWTDGYDGDRALYVSDLLTSDLLLVEDLGRTTENPHDVVVRPSLRGDLLTYIFAPADGGLQLRWAVLR